MTFANFKTLTAYHLKEDGKQPEDTVMSLLVYEAVSRISTLCVPMVLAVGLENAIDANEIFRIADSNTYIRRSKTTYTDTDEIDIDEELAIAAIFFVCSQITIKYDKKTFYDGLAMQWIGQYNANFNRYQYED
jgi:hypothetical protein